MTSTHIKDLFANDVARPIEEVIKVDQNDEEIPLAVDDASGYLLPDLGGINLAGFED